MGSTYTRQSSAGIVDGGVIEASDLNDEFDQLLAAFAVSTGHSHDGTAAEGGPVTKLLGTSITIGDGTAGTDLTITFDGETSDGVLYWMEDEDHFKFADDVVIDSSKRLYLYDEGGEYIYGDGTDLYLTSGADINIPSSIGLTFGNDGEKIEGDGTDLTITGNTINLTATTDVALAANTGLLLAGTEKIESDGTDLSITVGAGGDINIGSDIGLTFGNDGEKIEGDGTDLTISGNNINLTAVADVVIPADVGITFGSGEKIEGNSTDLTVTSGADINLTATSDINIPSDVGVTFGDDGEKIEGDGTNLTIATSNNVTVDAAADIILDAGGADVTLKDDGTTFGSLTQSGGELLIKSGSTPTTALTFSGANVTAAGNLSIGGDLDVTGSFDMSDANITNIGSIALDTITNDGTDITLDSSGDIILDAAGDTIFLKDAGTTFGSLDNTSGNLIIKSGTTTAATFSGANVTLAGTVGSGAITSTSTVQGTTITATSAFAGTLSTAAQTNITSLGTLTALTVDDVAINGKVVTMTGSASDTVVLTAGTNGTLDITTTDAAAAAANIQITADGTVDIDSAGVLTLDSGAAINIEPAAGSAILLDGTISVDAGVVTGATSITSTAFVGALTGNVTGNASGTAATVTTAAQTNITSLGTLTALTVDDVAINGKVVTMTGSASDTAVLTAGTNGTLSIVTTDAAAAAANIQITADGTVDIDSAGVLTLDSGAAINIEPAAGSAILLDGTISVDAGVVTGATSITSTAFVGDITGDVTGNTSGTAATVTTAAQTNITSLGTLTTLTVDNVIINGTTIGHTSDTDLITLGSAIATVAGEVSMTTLDIGGTNVTSTAAELNILDGVTSTATELNYSDLTTLGTSAASKVLSADSNNLTKITGGVYLEEDTLTFDATQDWDVRASPVAQVTLTANVTFDLPSNPTTGQYISILCIQDGTGSRTIAWNAAFEFTGGTAPTATTTAAKGDLFTFRYHNSHWIEVGRNLNLTRA
jgi:hypothetical protein